jgi:hypothetical protein
VGIVATLLAGGAWKWYKFKEDLRNEGVQECVQEINQATVDLLEDALAAEKRAAAALRASLIAAATVNQEAVERRDELSNQLDSLRGMMEKQKNEDPTYREWSDTPLPDGVASRLRQAAGSSSGSSN